jgi:hypothetical protein
MDSPQDATSSSYFEMVGEMGWIEMPFGCFAIVRHRKVNANHIWSWLILVPWAMKDSKPWLDGYEVYTASRLGQAEQRQEVLIKLRGLLDDRYGEAFGTKAMDEFLKDLNG